MPDIEFAVEVAGMLDASQATALIGDVERLGFDQLWWCDFRFYRDVYPLLAWTAAHSERIRFGPFVTDPYVRHPAITATAMATVDEMSGGRGVLGFGAGVSGLAEMGVNRVRPSQRVAEAVDLIRMLWREGRADFVGDEFEFHGQLDFVPRADIPIYIASNSPRILSVAGEKADGIIIEALASEWMLDYVRDQVRPGADRAGREVGAIPLVARLDLCMHDDRQVALDVLRGRVQHFVSVHGSVRWPELAALVPPELEAEIQAAGFTHDPMVVRRLAEKVPLDASAALALGGNDEDVFEKLCQVRALGVRQVSVFPIPSAEHGITIAGLVQRFGKVVTRFKQEMGG